MKKFFVIFALFCAVFLVSCGSGSDDETADQPEGNSDTDTETDNESESQDSSSQDTGKTDTEETASDDDSDAAEPQRNEGELYGECYPNNTCNEGLVCDTENNICINDDSTGNDDSDSGDPTNDKDANEDKNDAEPQPDDDTGDPKPDEDNGTGENDEEKCIAAGGTYRLNGEGSSCTKTADCAEAPENSVWNDGKEGGESGKFTQTLTDSGWNPQTHSSIYSLTAGECKYKCKETYFYYDSQCLNPCDNNPCAEIANAKADSCLASSREDYSCVCEKGYFWHQMQCKKPLNIGNICTGQTTCYDGTSELETCPSSGEDFYGQDAQFTDKCTPQSFTPGTGTLTGTVFDNNTNLTWKQSPVEAVQWKNAEEQCNKLNNSNDEEGFAGIKTWRVPNFLELLTILDSSRSEPAINTNFNFPNTIQNLWTSSVVNPQIAYVIVTSTGRMISFLKSNSSRILCVSGDELLPSAESDFETSSDGKTVTDKKTGLMWQSGCEENKTWQEAMAYCRSLNTGTEPYAGYTDWRVPNKNELASLLNTSKSTAPRSYFPNMSERTFWSSSTRSSSNSEAWYIKFSEGFADTLTKTKSADIRCVRNAE